MNRTKTTYAVCINHAAHTGHIARYKESDLFSPGNPDGLSYNDIAGAFHNIVLQTHDEAEAKNALAAHLECDAKERNRYCYAHNAGPKPC